MKHINLTQMLQGCSKRNGMTVSASGSDGAQTSEVKRQTLSSKKGKWSKNEALHSTCLRSASVPLSYCPHYLSRIAVILCILVMSVGQAWGGQDLWNGYIKATFNGTKCWGDTYYEMHSGGPNASLGTAAQMGILTGDFVITDVKLKFNTDWDTHKSEHQCWYNVDGSGGSDYWISWGTSKGDGYPEKLGVNYTIARHTDASGYHSVNVGFQSQIFWNDNDHHTLELKTYYFSYTVLPPAVSTFTVTPTGAVSGDGTEGNPYIIPYGGDLKLTMSGSQEHSDANSSAKYYNTSSASSWTTRAYKTISNVTETSNQSVTIKMCYENNSSSELHGTESTKTVYYKAAQGVTVYKFQTKSSGLGNGNVPMGSLTTPSPLQTLIGGTLAGAGSNSSNLKYNENSFNFNGGNSAYLQIGLDNKIKAGDVIRYRYVSGSGNVTLSIQTTKGTTSNQINLTGSSATNDKIQTVEITSAQATAFASLSTIYLVRTGSNTAYLDYFEILRPYTVTLDANTNGGKVDGNDTKKLYFAAGESQLLPRATKSSNRFMGWFTGASSDVKVSDYYAATASTTLYAQYEACSTTDATVYKFQLKTGLTDGSLPVGVTGEGEMEAHDGNYLSSLVGGTMTIHNKNNHIKISDNSKFIFDDNGPYLIINLDCALATGDIFKATTSTRGICVTKTTSRDDAYTIPAGTNQELAVPAGFVGAKTLYLWRGSGSGNSKISYFEIYRPEACTEITPTWSTDYSSTTLNVGATSSTPIVGKGGSSGAVSFSSGDDAIATVNSSGVVTAVKTGSVTITATVAANGSYCEGTVTKDFTIKAGVTYNANGASGGSVPTDANKYAVNDIITIAGNTGSLYKTGYVFNGWNTKANGTGTHYEVGATMKMPNKSGNITLFAEWVGYATSWEWWNSGASNGSTTFTYLTGKNYVLSFASSADAAVASWDISGDAQYRGVKIKTKDHNMSFWVQSGKRVSITFGYRSTKPTFTVGGVDKSDDVGTGTAAKDTITVTYSTSADTKFYIENETATKTAFTVKSVKIEDDAPSCSAPTSPTITGTTNYTAGETISLTASATGTDGSTTYTWYKGDNWAAASATSSIGSAATYTKASCVVGDAGTYWCNISNGTGCEVQVSKTITVSCNAVAAPTALTCSAHTTTTLTFGWTGAEHASGYVAKLWTNSDCSGEALKTQNLGNVNSVTFTSLTPSATYYCKVQSKGDGSTYCADGGTTAKQSGTTDAPTAPTFSPASGSTVSGSQTITITGHSGSTVYYKWATSAQDAAAIYDGGSGSHGTADVGTASVTVQSGKMLYAISRLSDVNSSVSSASYTVDATAPTLSSSVPADGATNVAVSGTIVLTFSEAIASVDGSKFSLTGATKGVVAKDGSDAKKVNIAYSEASNSTTVTLATDVGAVTDAVGNSSAALSSISFTTEAAAPAGECVTWEGDPSSWTSHSMTVDENLVLKAVGKDWAINSSTVNPDYAKVWVEGGTEIKKTVIAIDDNSVGKYLQGSFADGSVIRSLTIGAANNSGTAGTNNNYVVMFSATEDFATVLADGSGNKAQVVSAPSYKDTYNASNLEKSITVPTGAKFFRIYRKIVGEWTIGDWTVPSDMGSSAKFRIFKIEACPEGSACTDPTIEWDNTPASGLVGGSMTASVTSNYPAGVSYSSSDPTVASVNASTGVISYLKAGTTTITATVVGDDITYCDLAVDPSVSQLITVTAPATGIAISPATIDVQVGGMADLTATLTPAGAADATVNWTSEYSSNATVAIIGDNNKTARVTGVALRPSGTSFKIYAKTASLTANSWYATVRVYKGVTYNATTNGGTCATASAKYYGDAALVLPAATKDGYTFNGWYTTASGDGTKIGEAGDEYTPTANSTTLYARFTKNVTTYAITYELNGGTHGSTHPATGTPDAAHELSAPTRSGYTFVGWTVSPVVSGAKCGTTSSPTTAIEDASTLAVNGTSSVYFKNLAAANGAVTITAHWTQDCESGDPVTYYSYTISSTSAVTGATATGGTFTSYNNSSTLGQASGYYTLKDNDISKAYFIINTTNEIAIGDKISVTTNNTEFDLYTSANVEVADNVTTYYTVVNNDGIAGTHSFKIGRHDSGSQFKTFTVTRPGSGASCYHVTYHANGAERGTVEDAARYVEGATVTVKPNGYTKTGADFLGWATNESRADAGTIDYDPDDSFTMGTADVDLWAVWGTAAPRVYALTGSAYRCTGDAESTITLAGSETGVNYQLKKDGENDGVSVTGTGSALTWNKSAWGTYTVVATRSAVSVDMSGEVVLSDYPLSVTENLDGGTVAQDGEFTLSAKVSVNADNSDDYTYEWFRNDAANYDTPLSLGAATAMVASTGTQQFDYNPSTASGGTIYYFCKFTSPCGTVVRTRVVSVTVTTSTTTLTWDRDGEGDDFEYLPQGGKHTITVSSNSGVAPSLAVAGTDAEITNVEQEGSTTTATLILGASAADVVLTAEVSANGTYAAKSEDKEVIVKECSSDEDVLLSAHLSAYNAFTVDEGSGTATISNPGSDDHVTCNTKSYYKMKNGSTYYTLTLGGKEKFQAGDRIVFDVASCDQGNEKEFIVGLKASTSGSELHSLSTTLTTCDEKEFTIPVGSGLIDGNTVIITRKSSENRVYGVSIVRGGGSGSSADVASVITWITDPDPGQGSKAITRSISNDPFTYAVQATTPSMGTITYASSNEAVATVDANGRVTLIGEGATTISAKQEAIGCYMASSTLSYSLTVESCTGEKEPVITYDGTVICPDDSKTLTATNYEDGATFQWYKDGAEIGGATDETYDATAAGTYTVVAHKDCYSESSNSVTLTKMSATVDVKTLADEFTIKSERPYNFRLFEIEDGATIEVQSRLGIDAENSVVTLSGNIISISGTAPTIASAGDATIDIRISRTGGCSSISVDKTVTIHKIPATSKKTIAWIATKTTIKDKKEVAVKGVKDEVDADKSSDVDLYQELEKYYTVTARNCYWTASEAELVKEYSQYDLIVLTDYPNSQTAPSGNDKSKSYTNAIGLLKDHIPMLTFEAYVAQCPNWEIPSNPKNTSNTQNDITLLCNADDIFGTSGKFGAGSAISVSTVGSGQALQGFLPADAPFVFIGSITDDGTTYIACCERQVNPAARMLIFGLNANTMNNLTSDGKEMVRGFINYLMISDAASIPDCSVIFNGGAGDGKWETVGNWEGGTLPGKYASVRIDKPCVVSGDYVAEAGYLKIHTSTNESDYPYTGKLTIASDGVMAIDGTITRVEDNRYTLHLPTRPEDLIIESDASGQGALIFDNDDGETQATVELYSLGRKKDGHYQFQYYAVPMDYVSVSESFAGSDIYTYVWHEATGWERRGYYTDLYAFEGVGITTKLADPKTYTMKGALASTETKEITLTKDADGYNLIGNSWTAPIQISQLEEDNGSLSNKTVYIYNAGNDTTAEKGTGTGAGQWTAIPFNAAGFELWSGLKVIPAMQAFELVPTSEETLTLDYEKVVRGDNKSLTEPLHAPRRVADHAGIELMRIRVADSQTRTDLHLFEGERFSDEFDNGWEAAYMDGDDGTTKLYADVALGRMAVVATDELEGTLLGFAPGKEMDYTFSFGGEGMGYYLNDLKLKTSTLISEEATYSFTYEEGDTNRFYISRTRIDAPQTPTGVENTHSGTVKAHKFIYNDKLYIMLNGRVYSAEGQIVK